MVITPPPEPRTGLPQRGADPARRPTARAASAGGHGRHEDRERWRATSAATSTWRTSKPRPKSTRRNARLMVTYPRRTASSKPHPRGVDAVHDAGRQIMDGANMGCAGGTDEPQLHQGPDVCHLNLHKTFAMPPRRRLSVGDLRRRAPAERSCRRTRSSPRAATKHHGRRVGPVGFGAALPDHLRLYQNAGAEDFAEPPR